MNYWLIKSDPETYPWEQMKKDKSTFWDGVKNYQARNFMKEMKVGDVCLFYLSNKEKAICGEVKVIKEHYQDPTTDDDRWVAVDVEYLRDFKRLVFLKEIKSKNGLDEMYLVRNSRLSVSPIKEEEYKLILELEDS